MRKLSSNSETSFLKSFFHILLIFFCVSLQAQEKEFWLINIQTDEKTLVKDSVSAVKFLDSLTQNNYYLTELRNVKKEANRTEIYFDTGKNFNEANVKLTEEIAKNLHLKQEFFTKNLDSLKKEINASYRARGFTFNRVKSKFLGMQQNIPHIEI